MMKKTFALLIGIAVSFSGYSQSCLPGGISFHSQTEIDNFQVNYPGCTEIIGGIIINGFEIDNLNGLSIITSIGGDLEIHDNVKMASLHGLDALVSVGLRLLISDNESLTDLSGLNKLTSVGKLVNISGNDNLANMDGLNELNFIGGSLEILNNPVLTSLAGLNALSSIGEGSLIIKNNESLTGLSGLSRIDANTIKHLYIVDNPYLANCEIQNICEYLTGPNGTVNIYNNDTGCNNAPEIADACGITLSCLPFGNYYFYHQSEIDNFHEDYSGCSDLKGIIQIRGNDISDLEGLSDVASVSGDFYIYDNDSLTSLSGLNSLLRITGNLNIWNNDALTNMAGLDNLETIAGDIRIGDGWRGGNLSLISLAGLEKLKTDSISFLLITKNTSLSTCGVKSICDYIAEGGSSYISYNAPGCNSENEIAVACGFGIVESDTSGNLFHLLPNPSSSTITIELPQNIIAKCTFLTICDMNGRQIISKRITEQVNILDIRTLPEGVYFVKVKDDNTVQVRKFAKQ